jgi:hypothetical protein
MKKTSIWLSRLKWPAALVGLAVFVFGGWYAWGTYGVSWFAAKLKLAGVDKDSMTILGQMGDVFGGINALFAALAFAGVAIAAFSQHKTWQLAERQHTQQAFEPLFFQLVTLHREHATELPLFLSPRVESSIEPEFGVIYLKGKSFRAFDEAMEGLRGAISKTVNWGTDDGGRGQLTQIYSDLYDLNEETLGPYFRSLYHVFKLIDQSALSEEDQIRYANIARSTLGRNDVFFLAINCVGSHGADFKPLVERYGLLKHISRRSEPDRLIATKHFAPTAVMSAEERQAYWKSQPVEPTI